MKFLRTEIRKLITRRFILLLLAAILANLLLFWHSQNNGRRTYYDQASYQAAQQDALAMGAEERTGWLQEKKRLLDICYRWQTYHELNKMGWSDAKSIDEEMLQYQSVYESGSYLEYADSLYEEREIFSALLQELNRVNSYQATLDAAIEEAKLKTSIPIFAKPGTFPYRSQLAMIDRLEVLREIKPAFDVSDGVLSAQNSAATDLLALLLVMVLCTEIIIAEHNNGMLPILRATRKGRLPLILSKAGAAVVFAFFITLALWGSNLAYSAATIGLGDLSRPVQSLAGYTVCTLEVSVGTYLLLVFLFKWLVYSAIGILCLILGLMLQSTVATWLTIGGFLSVEYILCQTITPISAWNILKYVNVSNLIFTTEWLSEYRNLNFFGYPVEVFTAACVLTAVLLVLGMLLLCFLFCRRKIRALPKLRLSLQWPRWLPRPGRSTALFGHEWWKLLAECGALLVLALFIALNVQEPHSVFYDMDSLYYMHYMHTLEGPLTEEQELFLEEEQVRFDELRSQIRQLSRDFADGLITEYERDYMESALESALKPEKIFKSDIVPRIEQLKAMKAEGKEVWVVYEPGYEYLFGVSIDNDKTDSMAMMLAAAILCFANFYPLETVSGMQPLLNVYRRGRGNTARCKITISLIVTVVLFVIAQIPDYWYVAKNYGFSALQAPLCSLEAFSGWNDSVSILGGILLFEGLRLLTAISVVAIVLLLSVWVRNQVATLSLSAGILLLPLLLHLLGVTVLDPVSFCYPLTGTNLLCAQEPLARCVLYYGAACLAGAGCIAILLRYVHTGFQHILPRVKTAHK